MKRGSLLIARSHPNSVHLIRPINKRSHFRGGVLTLPVTKGDARPPGLINSAFQTLPSVDPFELVLESEGKPELRAG